MNFKAFLNTIICLGLFVSLSWSQILDPVKWSTEVVSLGDHEYELVFHADIEQGWKIYSQYLESDDGPVRTTFEFDGDHYELIGKNEEKGKVKEGFDEIFEMNVISITGHATFHQKVKSTSDQPITGYLVFMTCDATRCLPPKEVEFSFSLTGESDQQEQPDQEQQEEQNFDETMLGFPFQDNFSDKEPVGECSTESSAVIESSNLGRIFALGFVGGLLALLTPCVFPMIPLTVSFFTKSGQNRKSGIQKALLYGGFILLVYVILSIPFHLLDTINPNILNDISTNVWLNIFFFAVFIFFAFSFFGYYELTLPSNWTNKVSQAEGVGGMVGVFFMALTLALVSFSCTGPILGSLLAGSLTSNGGAMQLTSGMTGFGLALALPFTLFAAFPSMMQKIPKSGSWLNTVKVVLGFLELALAFKFLSNADLVKRWGLLKIEPFLIIWIIIFALLGIYLFGKMRFPHDSRNIKLKWPRMAMGTLSIVFAIYLATGFRVDSSTNTFHSLKLLSGLAPPVGYSWLYPNNCPHDLDCFKDLDEGVAFAKSVNKPILIDFTGHACVNCRKMEEHVWPEPGVFSHIKDDYVLVSLYVDEKIELPQDEQVIVENFPRGLKTVGNKWSYFQSSRFNNNSQPLYVLLSPNGELLNSPLGYTPDVDTYKKFLDCGLDAFQRLNSVGQVWQ